MRNYRFYVSLVTAVTGSLMMSSSFTELSRAYNEAKEYESVVLPIMKKVSEESNKLEADRVAIALDLDTQQDISSKAFFSRANEVDSKTMNILCLLYTSPSPRDKRQSRMPSSA